MRESLPFGDGQRGADAPGPATGEFDIERRQKLVFRLRFVETLTESQIVTRLARVGIVTSRPTVSRDVAAAKWTFRSCFSEQNFDARSEFGTLVTGLEQVISPETAHRENEVNGGVVLWSDKSLDFCTVANHFEPKHVVIRGISANIAPRPARQRADKKGCPTHHRSAPEPHINPHGRPIGKLHGSQEHALTILLLPDSRNDAE